MVSAEEYPYIFAAKSISNAIRENSSSGGIFYALAEQTIRDGGIVYACTFDIKMTPVHVRCTTMEECRQCMGSKYSQSRLDGCLKNISEDIKSGRRVLFVGTPCQADAIKQTYEAGNLITVDLICHGVPSPKVFELYIDGIKSERKRTPENYLHRPKDIRWGHIEKVLYTDGGSESDTYLINAWRELFYKNKFLRPSCYACPYSQPLRYSDITLGDYWGIQDTSCKKMYDELGVSVVFVNTEKGYKLFNSLKEVMRMESDLMSVVPGNPMLLHPSTYEGSREEAWIDLYNNGFRKMTFHQGYRHTLISGLIVKIRYTLSLLLKKWFGEKDV